ncbi:rRNA N6-adenosine-methyltransferase METTL5 [Nematocida sp. AWRm77]|nr:rRNA N6-adenosine-methyltransferase METTL5 [Nematocida sp. AWRm77]
MRLKEKKWALDAIAGFPSPQIKHEQYMTPAELSSAVTHVMETHYGDIEGKTVLDLGCGTGMLSAACSLYGPESVIGVDIDFSLEETYAQNMQRMGADNWRFICQDVLQSDLSHIPACDTGVINPPFGTKQNKGIDARFLEVALSMCSTVYSMHKTSTRAYFQNKYKDRCTVVSQMKFALPKSYKFHKKEIMHVDVDLLRVTACEKTRAEKQCM